MIRYMLLLLVFLTAVPPGGCARRDPNRLSEAERQRYAQLATEQLDRVRAPWQDRQQQVEVEGKRVVVTFPPPAGELAGPFIIRIDRRTDQIVDVQLWR